MVATPPSPLPSPTRNQKKRTVNNFTHIKTLIWKNYVLKKRHYIQTILEVFLPVTFIILMGGLKTLVDDVTVPSGWSDANAPENNKTYGNSYSLFNPNGISGMELGVGGRISTAKYAMTETTMSGLLMYMAMKSGSEITDVDKLTQEEKLDCQIRVSFLGSVSTNFSSLSAIPEPCRNKIFPHKLAIVPDNAFTRKYFFETIKTWYPRVSVSNNSMIPNNPFAKVTIPSIEDSTLFFKSEAELEDHVTSSDYGRVADKPKIFGAIVFDKAPKEEEIGSYAPIEYSIRMNSTVGRRGVPGMIPRTLGDPAFEFPFQRLINTDFYFRYQIYGFNTLQTLVTRFVNCMPEWDTATQTTNKKCQRPQSVAMSSPELNERLYEVVKSDVFIQNAIPLAFGGNLYIGQMEFNGLSQNDKETLLKPLRIAPQPFFNSIVAPFPIKGFVNSPFYDSVKNVFAIAFVLANLYAVSRILVVLIQEKETRSREYMKILGVGDNPIILSWYITYGIILFVASVLQALASKAGLFANSDIFLLFIFYFLFSLTVLAFGFLVSALFSRSRTGAFSGIVLFFFMYFVSSGYTPASSVQAKASGCIFSPVALAFGVQALANAESTGVGMNFQNARLVVENFSFQTAISMLFFDFFLYSIIGWYLDKIMPKEFGTCEKWYFFISPTYWKQQTSQKVNDLPENLEQTIIDFNPNIEKVGTELEQQEKSGQALVIQNLQKNFQVPGGIKKAVKNVSLTMYKDQITCLLGHNGAGKTTLISMLTGILAPSGGDAFFQGFSFKNNMKQIRQSLGLCFQHDVLYKELTVEEHLIFYARIKGYTGEQLNEVVQTKIKEVGLTEKRFVRSAALSGGMKRKLSVAISLLGDSSLVFLDEPTSGMDPYSRRSTWEILLNNRQNRVVVLTTHFMDEADILGDRIAIMAEGELRCCGSSLFLKNRYGAGYNFTLVKDEGCKEVKLIEFVSSKVPSARVLSNVGAEIAFQLPLDSSSCFASMFEQLDANLKEFGILQYGISVTTMEEVFIKVAEAHDEENQHTLNKEVQGSIAPSKGSRTSSIAHLSGFKMFLIHLQALLFKRFRVAKRDRRVLIFSAILPVILLFAGFALLKSSSLTKSDVKLPLNTAKFKNEADMPIPFYCEADDDKWCSFTMENLFEGGKTQKFTTEEMGVPPYTTNPSVFGIDYSFFSPNETFAYCLRFSDKVFQRAHGLDESHEVNTSSTPVLGQYAGYLIHGSSKDNIFGYNMFLNTTATHGGAIFKALMDESIYRFFASNGTNKGMEAQYNLTVFQYPLPFTATTKALFGSFLSFTACLFIVIAFAFFPASIVVFLVKEKQVEHNSKHQQLVSGVSIPAFWLSNYIWDLFTYILPFAAAIILIKTFDVSAFTGNDCNSCTNETFPAVVLIFILFGFAMCPFTYCLSYFFREHASSQTYTIIVNFMLGVVLMVVSFILDVIDSSVETNKVLKYFWRLSPLFNLGNGLLNLSLQEIKFNFGFLGNEAPSPFDLDVMGWEMLYLGLTSILFTLLAVGIDFLLSFPEIKAALFKDPIFNDPPYEEDEDVKREAERVLSGRADGDAVKLKNIRKVYKGNKVAVRNLSFGLPKGECFGYLGINGAGKTTTMKMLTGDILPSSGVGTLGGFDILSQQLEVRRLIGYCPQFDALFELLSVREHLELFARIKGVAAQELSQVVKELMHQMNLDDFEHKLAGTLSGGNKRKLSVAIAMIGSPAIIFLDEPSTGMDPVSRRFMWNVIADISTQRKESTIILTTHSMEECEALCTRVGIMVGGRLRCLGSVQHLKSRFGNGLMTEIKVENASNDEVVARVNAVFGSISTPITVDALRGACEKLGNPLWADCIDPRHSTGYSVAAALNRDGSIRASMLVSWWIAEERFLTLDAFLKTSFGIENALLVERQNDLCRYKLFGSKDTLKLSNVFRLIEAGKETHHIREYSVSQTTLEQIFNHFAAQQNEEKGVARGLVAH